MATPCRQSIRARQTVPRKSFFASGYLSAAKQAPRAKPTLETGAVRTLQSRSQSRGLFFEIIASSNHFRSTSTKYGFISRNETPIPRFGCEYATVAFVSKNFASAKNFTKIELPVSNGFPICRKHPCAPISVTRAGTFLSEPSSDTSASALNGNLSPRRRSAGIPPFAGFVSVISFASPLHQFTCRRVKGRIAVVISLTHNFPVAKRQKHRHKRLHLMPLGQIHRSHRLREYPRLLEFHRHFIAILDHPPHLIPLRRQQLLPLPIRRLQFGAP